LKIIIKYYPNVYTIVRVRVASINICCHSVEIIGSFSGWCKHYFFNNYNFAITDCSSSHCYF